jgi:ORF6N domain
MPNKSAQALIPLEVIESKIFALRGHRVMLDRDLAELYGVETRVLNQAVKTESRPLSRRFYVRANAGRGEGDHAFKITKCDLKAGRARDSTRRGS